VAGEEPPQLKTARARGGDRHGARERAACRGRDPLANDGHPGQVFRQFQYPTVPLHLSGRDLADKLAKSMDHIHAWRVEQLAAIAFPPADLR
jgi:hypothetical protein